MSEAPYDTFPAEVAIVAHEYLRDTGPSWFQALHQHHPESDIRQSLVRFSVEFAKAYDRVENIADHLPVVWERHLLPETLKHLRIRPDAPFEISERDILSFWITLYSSPPFLAGSTNVNAELMDALNKAADSIDAEINAETLIGVDPSPGRVASLDAGTL